MSLLFIPNRTVHRLAYPLPTFAACSARDAMPPSLVAIKRRLSIRSFSSHSSRVGARISKAAPQFVQMISGFLFSTAMVVVFLVLHIERETSTAFVSVSFGMTVFSVVVVVTSQIGGTGDSLQGGSPAAAFSVGDR